MRAAVVQQRLLDGGCNTPGRARHGILPARARTHAGATSSFIAPDPAVAGGPYEGGH